MVANVILKYIIGPLSFIILMFDESMTSYEGIKDLPRRITRSMTRRDATPYLILFSIS